jgi:hypothetical protein
MIRVIRKIDFLISTDQVLEQLYPVCPRAVVPAPRNLKRHLARIREWITWMHAIIQPQGLYTHLSSMEIAAWPALSFCSNVAAGVVTLGERFDAELSRLQESGAMLDALLFDAAGSAAVEAACNAVDTVAGNEIARLGMSRTQRISPGYGWFSISEQKYLFERIPADQVGVTLTPGLMMHPLKSISFVFAFGDKPELPKDTDTCSSCSIANCRNRLVLGENRTRRG